MVSKRDKVDFHGFEQSVKASEDRLQTLDPTPPAYVKPSSISFEEAVKVITSELKNMRKGDEQIGKLMTTLKASGHLAYYFGNEDKGSSPSNDVTGLSGSIEREVQSQLEMLKGIRESVMLGSKIDPDVRPADAKAVLSAMNSTLSTLMRFQEKMYSLDRAQKFEQAVIDTLHALDEAAGDNRASSLFMDELEGRLRIASNGTEEAQ